MIKFYYKSLWNLYKWEFIDNYAVEILLGRCFSFIDRVSVFLEELLFYVM